MLRAWQALATFEDRGQLRAWLYRIATNVCINMIKGRSRRALPMHVGPLATSEACPVDRRPEAAWVQPAPDSLTLPAERDQAEHAVSRESVRIAFIAALQYLAPRQRVVLILRHSLGWRADEALVALFRDDAIIEMPALRSMATWKDEIRRWLIAVGAPRRPRRDTSERQRVTGRSGVPTRNAGRAAHGVQRPGARCCWRAHQRHPGVR
jgi:RNA polymerase sigma factor (sigma-70 family)